MCVSCGHSCVREGFDHLCVVNWLVERIVLVGWVWRECVVFLESHAPPVAFLPSGCVSLVVVMLIIITRELFGSLFLKCATFMLRAFVLFTHKPASKASSWGTSYIYITTCTLAPPTT
jgi:hypothetical protein